MWFRPMQHIHVRNVSLIRKEVRSRTGCSLGCFLAGLSTVAVSLVLLARYSLWHNDVKSRIPDVSMHDPDMCQEYDYLDWVFLAMSVAENSNRRRLLRETYGNMDLLKPYNFKLIFLVGKSKKAIINKDVRLEYLQYRDMVVVDFEDGLKYSTLKLVLGLDWVSKHCNRSPYFIKLNDDTFVNIFEIATLLDDQTITKNCIMCSVVTEEHIARFANDLKYFKEIGVSAAADGELSSYTRYPKHCAGDMVVFSNDVLPRLLEAINEISHFWQGDVYVTGFVAQSMDIEYVDISKHRAEPELMMKQYKDRTAQVSHYFAHVEDPDVFEKLWKLLMDRLTWKTQTPLTSV